MNHQCRLTRRHGRLKLDACCSYGADTDIAERDGILARRDEIAALLTEEAAATPWFSAEKPDKDFPSGVFVRTSKLGDGCVFLQHDGRGCAIHRASVEGGWDFRGIKPAICRLFPLTYMEDLICLSDDYSDYSCSLIPNAPTVYRVARETLGDVFGADLVVAMDATEAQFMGRSRGMRVIA
jgi:Fe-S-cluster containining protein